MARFMTVAMGLGVMLGTMVSATSPAAAAMAAITTVTPVDDDATEGGLKAAAGSALERAVRGAQAMGLAEVMLKSIRVVPGTGVVVEILATDTAPSGEDSVPAPEVPATAEGRRL